MSVQSAEDLIKEANSLFVDENYEGALKMFTEAIELEDTVSDYFTSRSSVYHKLSDFHNALNDANKAIALDGSSSKAHLRKGIAAFSLEDYSTAVVAFKKALELKPEASTKTWIRKCEAELASAGGAPAPAAVETPKPKPSATPAAAPAPTPVAAPPPVAATTDPAKIRHDWFQTSTHVTVCVMAKNTKKENCTVTIKEKELSVSIKLATGSEYQLNLDLAGTVVPSESRYDVLTTKIEIKMKKSDASKWNTLEDVGEKLESWGTVQDGPSKGLSYPSSARNKVEWDKVQVEEDKLEGDAALNQVFSGIFKNASDEQRMAMQKSFQESGGTVLSTNWDEVGKGTVKGSAPNGMEMKNWRDLNY